MSVPETEIPIAQVVGGIEPITQKPKPFIQSDGQTFNLMVKQGLVPGYSTIDKFGVNPQITPSTDPEDIWEFGGLYNYDPDNTAPIEFLSSSNIGDNQIIEITGLDIDGNEIIQSVTLTGQTNASLSTALWRVFRMENIDTTSPAGIIYCHIDASPTLGVPSAINTRAIINNTVGTQPHNQTLMTLFTIPKGKVGFLQRGELGLKLAGNPTNVAEFAHFHYQSRRFGKVFIVKKAVDSIVGGNSIYQDERTYPDIIPALTDLKLTVIEVSFEMGVWGTLDILLVDETKFTNEYLQSIGQPGF